MKPEIKQRIEQIKAGQVPAGYKKTKIGTIPAEWCVKKLSAISSRTSKKNTNGEIQTTYTNSATQGVIKQTDYFDKEISNRDSIDGYYVVEEDDYIYNPRISTSAPCGPVNKSHFKEKGIVSPLYTVFKMNQGLQKNSYIEFYFKSSIWHRYMCGVANYGARHDRMNITNDDLFGMPIAFPPIVEQEKIAEILSAQDKVIELKEKLLEEKKKQKKYLMQQLLTGKKRLPGFSGEWEKHKLGEFIIEHTEKTIKNNQYPVLTSSRQGLFLQSDYYNKEVASEDNTGYNVVPRGFFTYRHMSDDEIFKFNINNIVDRGIVSTLYPVFTTKNICNHYLQSLLNEGNEFKKFALLQKQGGSRTYMYLDKLKQLYVSVPCVEEQEAISRILLTCDNEKELLQKSFEQEKQKKKALMQLLLMGIVRV